MLNLSLSYLNRTLQTKQPGLVRTIFEHTVHMFAIRKNPNEML